MAKLPRAGTDPPGRPLDDPAWSASHMDRSCAGSGAGSPWGSEGSLEGLKGLGVPGVPGPGDAGAGPEASLGGGLGVPAGFPSC